MCALCVVCPPPLSSSPPLLLPTPTKTVVDECDISANAAVCTTAGQTCVDMDRSDTRLNDWMCVCSTGVGEGVTRAATCVVDECLAVAAAEVCSDAGQLCYDPNPAADGLDDWECRCPFPSVGTATKAAATCSFTGECASPSVHRVCTEAGQTCVDPDVSTDDDWVCVCVAPHLGENSRGVPALCGINDCTATCEKCELGACAAVGQRCIDPDAAIEGDWLCACPIEGMGEPTAGQPAICAGTVECSAAEFEHQCVHLSAAQCLWDDFLGQCVHVTPPLCVGFEQTECNVNEMCVWEDSCVPAGPITAETEAPEGNTSNATRFSASETGEDDDDCVLCWLLPLLLLLLCCCLLLAFLLCRRRQNANEAEDEKWNKQFEAEIEEGERQENMGLGERSPSKDTGDANQSLLAEEMSPRSSPESGNDGIDFDDDDL